MPRYNWSHPLEWLLDRINNAGEDELRNLAKEMATELDGDTIQDCFEVEMESDGYFEDLDDMGGTRDERNWLCKSCHKFNTTVLMDNRTKYLCKHCGDSFIIFLR